MISRATTAAPLPEGLTIDELLVEWRAHSIVYYGREHRNIECALRPLEMFHGHELAADFGPRKLKAVLERMVDGYEAAGKRYAGISRREVNKRAGKLKRVFKWAASEELVPANVYHALATVAALKAGRTSAKELPPILPVDAATVKATLPHLPRVVKAMVRFSQLTGCRPGEVCQLRPCDVDQSGDVWIYRPHTHKMQYRGRPRLIFIGPQAQRILAPFLKRRPEQFCFQPRGTKTGQAYVRESYARTIRRACVRNGIEPWHPNRLRHSLATEARKRFGLEAAQVLLGHSRADVTQIYAEKHEQLGVEAIRQIG
jgi:integrase